MTDSLQLHQLESPIRTVGPHTLNCRGRLLLLDEPRIMGILNVTPDSFSDGGKFNELNAAVEHVGVMLEEGADVIDVGAYSSRPGAEHISVEEEIGRMNMIIEAIFKNYPDVIVSVDTFRSEVASVALAQGVQIINDIYAGTYDDTMLSVVAESGAAYIAMHMQGNPKTMQKDPSYQDVVAEVIEFLSARGEAALIAGIADVVLDPGFGFGKRIEDNYELFRNLSRFSLLAKPVLVGISRKSMIYKRFGGDPNSVGELTAAMHLQALMNGAKLLRVHDVKETVRIIELYKVLRDGIV